LVGGFKLRDSNSTSIAYQSEGGLLSVFDYNNEPDIEKCLAEDCDYIVRAILTINKLNKEKKLVLNYNFKGKSIKSVQLISDFVIYTDEEVILYTSPVDI
jgi:hypothetical protein